MSYSIGRPIAANVDSHLGASKPKLVVNLGVLDDARHILVGRVKEDKEEEERHTHK